MDERERQRAHPEGEQKGVGSRSDRERGCGAGVGGSPPLEKYNQLRGLEGYPDFKLLESAKHP